MMKLDENRPMNAIVEPAEPNSLMHEEKVFAPSRDISSRAYIQSLAQYEDMYRRSIDDSEAFWLEQADRLDWIKMPSRSCRYNWNTHERDIRHTWFEDGKLNICVNCLDRHLITKRREKIALLWQGDPEHEKRTFTFAELHSAVCRLANALKSQGIQKGDRVCI